VLDVGNWDEARATMGRPGRLPGDPHFRDLYPVWLANESFPLAFSAEQVARVAESQSGFSDRALTPEANGVPGGRIDGLKRTAGPKRPADASLSAGGCL